MMLGRNTLRIRRLSAELFYAEASLRGVRERVEHLEKLVNVGTTRLDLHAQRLGALEDDVENLK